MFDAQSTVNGRCDCSTARTRRSRRSHDLAGIRVSNPWLEHEWSVIAANQMAKLRLRVVPSIVAFASRHNRVPEGLALAVAASLRHARCTMAGDGVGDGWWRGTSYRVTDIDLDAVVRHWRGAEGERVVVDRRDGAGDVARVLRAVADRSRIGGGGRVRHSTAAVTARREGRDDESQRSSPGKAGAAGHVLLRLEGVHAGPRPGSAAQG
jgi:hypothetical protein